MQYIAKPDIADELQATAMAVRMLPIKITLQRFPRLIREMSRSLNKNITFVAEGEDTEAARFTSAGTAETILFWK